jgi:aspartate carbamoyltransferase catalytic subunit
MKHLIDPTDLSVNEIAEIIALAQDIIANREKYSEVCRGKKLATLFYEPSTRTRLSFTAAMMELGGNVLGFADAKSSSVSKGETVQDTVRVINCFADIIAMRHKVEGAPLAACDVTSTPIINAGDGSHSHPTQTMTDLLTIKRELGTLNNLTIGLVGDLKYGRTTHSLLQAMSHFNPKFIFTAPEELKMPKEYKEFLDEKGIEYIETTSLDDYLNECDILYMTRVQQERFTDPMEYERVKDVYRLEASMLGEVRDNMKILHPLPRVTEIDQDVDDTKFAYYFKQAENGLYVRMAIISYLLGYK